MLLPGFERRGKLQRLDHVRHTLITRSSLIILGALRSSFTILSLASTSIDRLIDLKTESLITGKR